MKFHLIRLALLVLILIHGVSYAQTMFVSDMLRLTLRRGPSNEYKILGVLETGQIVEVLEEKDPWVRVNLPGGKSGWVLQRYLSEERPSSLKLADLQSAHDSLKKRANSLTKDNTALKTDNKELTRALSRTDKALNALKTDHETLKTEAKTYLELKAKYEKVTTELAGQIQRAETAETRVDQLETRQTIWWFVSGAGVLLLGFIIGFASRRPRRRSSLL